MLAVGAHLCRLSLYPRRAVDSTPPPPLGRREHTSCRLDSCRGPAEGDSIIANAEGVEGPRHHWPGRKHEHRKRVAASVRPTLPRTDRQKRMDDYSCEHFWAGPTSAARRTSVYSGSGGGVSGCVCGCQSGRGSWLSLTRSLTHTPSHSHPLLTHSLTRSLTHTHLSLLTHSLTHSMICPDLPYSHPPHHTTAIFPMPRGHGLTPSPPPTRPGCYSSIHGLLLQSTLPTVLDLYTTSHGHGTIFQNSSNTPHSSPRELLMPILALLPGPALA